MRKVQTLRYNLPAPVSTLELYYIALFETSTNGWWWASTAGRGEQGLREREREGERGRRRVRQVPPYL